MNKSIYSIHNISKVVGELSEDDLSFLAEIVTLKDHVNKDSEHKFSLIEIAHVYTQKYHPEVTNAIYLTDVRRGN